MTLGGAFLLASTLGLKAASPHHDSGELHRRLTGFLAGAGYEVADTEFWTGGTPVIRGWRGDCRIFILSASSLGWSNDMIDGLKQGDDQVFSVLDGQVHARRPGWWTAVAYRWSKLIRGLGMSRQAAMVLAVVARPECDAQAWNWHQLSAPAGGGSGVMQ